MRQDRDEPIRAYGARLRGQANVCRFRTKCSNCDADVDYTETILRDVLSRGLSDPEIQLDLFGDNNQDMTLEQVVRFVEAKEAGKRSATHLLIPHGTDALTSSAYKHHRREALKGPQQRGQGMCTYCGRTGHGRNAPVRVRRKECPAYGMTCNHYNRDHHFENVCRRKANTKQTKSSKASEQEDAIFDTLCEITTQQNRKHNPGSSYLQQIVRQMGQTTI